MFLDKMSTDLEPASDTLVLRSLTSRLKRERKRNEHLHYLLRDRNFHLKRLHNVVVKLRKEITFEEAQKTLTEYADSLEKAKIYIHRDLATLPKEYVGTLQDYLAAVANNIQHRNLVEEFELKYEKARGELFDCVHERDKIKAELDQFTLDVDKELEKIEAVKTWLIKAKAEGRVSMSVGFSLGLILGVEE